MTNLGDQTKLARPKFTTRIIKLVGVDQRDLAVAMVKNAPIDPHNPLEIRVGEAVKVRTLDQNAAYHAGPLRDIADQAWIEGRQYSAAVLHEHFKAEYLPYEGELMGDELARRVKSPETYRKWDFKPNGDRVLVGSTTELTKFGFGEFMEQVQAFGSNLGVKFSERDR